MVYEVHGVYAFYTIYPFVTFRIPYSYRLKEQIGIFLVSGRPHGVARHTNGFPVSIGLQNPTHLGFHTNLHLNLESSLEGVILSGAKRSRRISCRSWDPSTTLRCAPFRSG